MFCNRRNTDIQTFWWPSFFKVLLSGSKHVYFEGVTSFLKVSFSFSLIDPLGWPTVTASRDNCFCTCRPSVTFHNLAKQNKAKTMFPTGETVGLAEWIIDDTCLILIVLFIFKIALQATQGNFATSQMTRRLPTFNRAQKYLFP